MRFRAAWFLPRNIDVLGRLSEQLRIVERAVATVSGWSRGQSTEDAVSELREFTRVELEQRRLLNTAIRSSFSTPLEAEDLFEFGELLGEIVQSGYALVREADLSQTGPDPCLRAIVEAIANGLSPLAEAVRALPQERAAQLADKSLSLLTAAEHRYRDAIADLEGEQDLRQELRRRELYRRCEHLQTATQEMARRVWYSVFKTE